MPGVVSGYQNTQLRHAHQDFQWNICIGAFLGILAYVPCLMLIIRFADPQAGTAESVVLWMLSIVLFLVMVAVSIMLSYQYNLGAWVLTHLFGRSALPEDVQP